MHVVTTISTHRQIVFTTHEFQMNQVINWSYFMIIIQVVKFVELIKCCSSENRCQNVYVDRLHCLEQEIKIKNIYFMYTLPFTRRFETLNVYFEIYFISYRENFLDILFPFQPRMFK